jgi:hypothetical protein
MSSTATSGTRSRIAFVAAIPSAQSRDIDVRLQLKNGGDAVEYDGMVVSRNKQFTCASPSRRVGFTLISQTSTAWESRLRARCVLPRGSGMARETAPKARARARARALLAIEKTLS